MDILSVKTMLNWRLLCKRLWKIPDGCNPSYMGGGDWENWEIGKKFSRPPLKQYKLDVVACAVTPAIQEAHK
jgi:hypothetical protein